MMKLNLLKKLTNVFERDLVKIKYVKNTGPYRKILPAIKNAELDDVLVYADDDVVYDYKWLSSLISSFEKNERKYVVASRVRKITYNVWKRMKSYETFPIVTTKMVLPHGFIITGVGGLFSPKHIFTLSF
ncbi:glycosyltransferase [Klebsiella pneumoniae subsp. pneumoniae]|nr:glycosyltransferase [Klebsiella pneumoniae subsp. pneumoniae]